MAGMEFERLIDRPLQIGESPVWDEQRQCLWFVDILAPAILRYDWASRSLADSAMPSAVGSIGLASQGELVVALRSGVHLFNPDTGALRFLVQPEPDRPMNRLNDGKVGPDGCFWIGSIHDASPRQPTAALYRVTPEGKSQLVLDDLKASNGLAWSPDGGILYHADTRGPYIASYAFDRATGALSERRLLRECDEASGLPDGAAVDAEGCYWSAGVSAGCLNKLAPDGRLLDSIKLPVAAPTMPCFGGPDLRTVFVTSLAKNAEPGSLISFRVETPGLLSPRFQVAA
ncbi:SMP-30/gluconolactonase/LRE family protein [Ferrovibrio sp. MS7]|uniref:SMP-30/gluconolactonase/LRE family protein n=1 Tax=Ferrovibrio plantarum TaxID=3119164 RepID=UPI0031347D18